MYTQCHGNTANSSNSCWDRRSGGNAFGAVPQLTNRTHVLFCFSSFLFVPSSISLSSFFSLLIIDSFLSSLLSFCSESQKYSPICSPHFFYLPLHLTVYASFFPSAAPFPDHLIFPSLLPCFLIPVSLLQQTPSSFPHPLMSISLPIMSPSTPFLFDP